MNAIQIEELLERVAGNREFVIQMLEMFFRSSDERLSALGKEFDNRNYPELADQAHKLKGLVSNLSITQALPILRNLQVAAGLKKDFQIIELLKELETVIADAKAFFQNNPTLTV